MCCIVQSVETRQHTKYVMERISVNKISTSKLLLEVQRKQTKSLALLFYAQGSRPGRINPRNRAISRNKTTYKIIMSLKICQSLGLVCPLLSCSCKVQRKQTWHYTPMSRAGGPGKLIQEISNLWTIEATPMHSKLIHIKSDCMTVWPWYVLPMEICPVFLTHISDIVTYVSICGASHIHTTVVTVW